MKLLTIFQVFLLLSGCGYRVVKIKPTAQKRTPPFDLQARQTLWQKSLKKYLWITPKKVEPIGDPKAVKGGSFSIAITEFPPTYRTVGKDTRLQILSLMESLVYESLLGLDSKSLEYQGELASHYYLSEDKKTFRYLINPLSSFEDHVGITAKDIVTTFKLLIDKDIQDPSLSQYLQENFEVPIAENDLILRVTTKKKNWRNFMTFSSLKILPHHYLQKTDGKGFLKKYQYQMLPGSGPYTFDYQNTQKGKKLVLKRRLDYWGKDKESNIGLYNFDRLDFIVIFDDRLELERFKKGEFDFYIPSRAQWWVKELAQENNPQFKALERGLVLKKKIFNYKPLGISGIAFNTTEEPFNDKRVRQAFSLMWNVDQLTQKLFFNEYVRCKSYFQGGPYQNKNLPSPEYNPKKALQLLKAAGWEMNKSGFLQKEGKPLSIEMSILPGFDRIFTLYQQDLKQIGIQLDLKLNTQTAHFERVMKKQFKMVYTGWTGLLFPNPKPSMHSKFSKIAQTSNITGINSLAIDKICEEYDKTFEVSKRIELLQELDAIVVENTYYSFGWVAPYAARIAYWNKFSYPDSMLSYTGDWRDVFSLWWFDSEKNKKIQEALKNSEIKLKIEKVEVHPWSKNKKSNQINGNAL